VEPVYAEVPGARQWREFDVFQAAHFTGQLISGKFEGVGAQAKDTAGGFGQGREVAEGRDAAEDDAWLVQPCFQVFNDSFELFLPTGG